MPVLGWGTDEKALINILAHRDAAQRKHIQLAYEETYNESLTKRLESELSGHFEVLNCFVTLLPSNYTAFYLAYLIKFSCSESCIPMEL